MNHLYSYSRLDTFLKCPHAYKLRYIDKKPEIKSPALRIGGLAHEVIAAYMKHLFDSEKERDIEQALKILNSKIAACPENEFADLKEIIEEFVGSHWIDFSFQSDFAIEKQLSFNRDWQPVDWLAEDVYWRGVIDCLHWEQDLLVITDYKTNRQIDAQSVVDNSLQLMSYAWLAHLIYPAAENFLIRLDYVRHSAYRKRIIELEEIELVPEMIQAHVEIIEKEQEFKPQISSYCDYCSFQRECQFFQELMKDQVDGKLECLEDAQALATRVRAMESFIKQSKECLKNWIELNQPIEVGNEMLDFHKTVELSFEDPYALVQKLGSLGLKKEQIWPIINMARTKVKSALSKAGLMKHWEEIEGLLTENVKTTFDFRKMKD